MIGTNHTMGVLTLTLLLPAAAAPAQDVPIARSSAPLTGTVVASPAALAPTDVVAVAVSPAWVVLSWTPTGSAEYWIFRSAGIPRSWCHLATVPAGANQFDDVHVTHSSSYFYHVAAVHDSLRTAPSDTVYVSTPPLPVFESEEGYRAPRITTPRTMRPHGAHFGETSPCHEADVVPSEEWWETEPLNPVDDPVAPLVYGHSRLPAARVGQLAGDIQTYLEILYEEMEVVFPTVHPVMR